MKKAIAWLLVIAMTAAISIAGTLAYLTDTDEDVNVMTVGQVKIDQLEYERVDVETNGDNAKVQEFHDNKPLYPAVTKEDFKWDTTDGVVDWKQIGKEDYTSPIWDPAKINNEVDKMVFVKNKGDFDAYVRTVFAFEAGNYQTLDEFNAKVHLNLNTTDWDWEWTPAPVKIGEGNYFVATATYNKVLKPGALTEISLSQIALDPSATNDDVAAFGDTYQVLVQSQAVQVAGFTDADTALNEAFGEVGNDATPPTPFPNDNPTKGIDLKTALRNYKGDSTNSIAKKVTNVVFGLTGDYATVAEEYTGTLVDVEQDVPVYAYYVPNGSNYDVYFLANDEIFLPERSSNLFSGMSALQTVSCDNLDTSRTTNMYEMFYNCTNLTTVDTADWDVSKVTNMCAMFDSCASLTTLNTTNWNPANVKRMEWLFNGCSKLNNLDVSNWNVGSATTMSCMFRNCSALTSLDVSKWNVGNVTDMSSAFSGCGSLTSFSATNWNVTSVINMKDMFRSCGKLATVDIAGWNPCNVKDMRQVFLSCSALTEMDMANWDISSVEKFNGMFCYCSNLKTVKVDNWKPDSAVSFLSMFHDCKKLQGFNAKGWQLPNMLTCSHMFRGCNSATSIDVSDWYTPKLTSMDAMFHTCKALTEVDLSSFDTSNCTELSQIFDNATGLKRVKGLEKWDTSNCKTFEETFAACYALEELDLSSFNTRNVVNAFYPMQNNATGWGFRNMFSSMSNQSLKKLVIGADFSFDGDGKVTDADNKVTLPNPGPIDGQATMWYNEANDTYYDASEIPEEVAAVYIAKVPPANP